MIMLHETRLTHVRVRRKWVVKLHSPRAMDVMVRHARTTAIGPAAINRVLTSELAL
jgi:hypothetical protein